MLNKDSLVMTGACEDVKVIDKPAARKACGNCGHEVAVVDGLVMSGSGMAAMGSTQKSIPCPAPKCVGTIKLDQ